MASSEEHIATNDDGRKDDASESKAQKIKAQPSARLCGIDVIAGHAKPDQYGFVSAISGTCFARAFGRRAFLTTRVAVMRRYGILPKALPGHSRLEPAVPPDS
jgi:hypothetical protein